ncbi:MAG: 4'-phosphopantetheinyl transferase superfamily protein [Ruminiclostridium sp.]|nr:4'-phosphopantetheinyl transferase superfamily protein [Ruminiclostridium sp.]
MIVYILKNENQEALLPFMSEQRLEKINGIKAEKVRAEKICSYALLRYALFMEYGVTEPPVFSYGDREKPYLKNYPEIFFNLSHADGWSACAVSDEEIGIDLQDYRPMKYDISEKICTKKEIYEVYGGDNPTPSETACRLWCMKESYGKLTGKGFAEGFDTIETSELLEKGVLKEKNLKLENKDFFLSVCGYKPIDEIETECVTEKDVRYILS